MHHIIILAAGKGVRMGSEKPKVLRSINHQPIILHLLNRVRQICDRPTVIIGHQGELIQATLGEAVDYVWQREQRGTGHALLCAKAHLAPQPYQTLIVLPGDHPLLQPTTVKRLLEAHESQGRMISIGTVLVPHFEDDFQSFYHCGRILRDREGAIKGIVEFKDATEKQRRITEVNVSYYCFDSQWLWKHIERLHHVNAAGEYYLTDMIALAVSQGHTVGSIQITDPVEGMGVNTPQQLAIISRHVAG